MFEKVVEIISKGLNIKAEDITMQSNLQDDLGADSLDAVDLVMTIEDELGVTVPDDRAQDFRTVEDIVSFLEETV